MKKILRETDYKWTQNILKQNCDSDLNTDKAELWKKSLEKNSQKKVPIYLNIL